MQVPTPNWLAAVTALEHALRIPFQVPCPDALTVLRMQQTGVATWFAHVVRMFASSHHQGGSLDRCMTC